MAAVLARNCRFSKRQSGAELKNFAPVGTEPVAGIYWRFCPLGRPFATVMEREAEALQFAVARQADLA